MKLTANETRARWRKVLTEYLEQFPDGQALPWIRFEADLKEHGVVMNGMGKELVREALHKLRRPYKPVPGEGIVLSSPDNAIEIAARSIERIDGALRGAEKTGKALATRHLPQMTSGDQKRLTEMNGQLGSIRSITKSTEVKMLAEGGKS